jgi:hypothetical protein
LRTRVLAETGPGLFQTKLAKKLHKAGTKGIFARRACGKDNFMQAKSRLHKMGKRIAQYVRGLDSRGARKQLDATRRAELAAAGESIATDIAALRSQLECPADAAH